MFKDDFPLPKVLPKVGYTSILEGNLMISVSTTTPTQMSEDDVFSPSIHPIEDAAHEVAWINVQLGGWAPRTWWYVVNMVIVFVPWGSGCGTPSKWPFYGLQMGVTHHLLGWPSKKPSGFPSNSHRTSRGMTGGCWTSRVFSWQLWRHQMKKNDQKKSCVGPSEGWTTRFFHRVLNWTSKPPLLRSHNSKGRCWFYLLAKMGSWS